MAQESYIKAYMSCDKLENPDSFSAWLYRIGYNTFLDQKRSQKPTTDYDDVRQMTATDAADASFRYQELYSALNRLPDKERTSILLYYLEGYQIKEITEIVGASESAVKQHLSRGRNHLRGASVI